MGVKCEFDNRYRKRAYKMNYTGYDLLWLFFFYSFIGWGMETAYATVKNRRFVNRGLINGPFCIIYGISMAFVSVSLQELEGIWLFLGVTVYTTVIEWIAGLLVEILYQERWWDYSHRKWNLDGYICLTASLIWGILGYAAVRWLNALVLPAFRWIPGLLAHSLIWVLVAILTVDVVASHILIKGRSRWLKQWEFANDQIAGVSIRISAWIIKQVERRLKQAYPEAYEKKAQNKERKVFAAGCGFYKIVLLFIIGAFLGDLVETVYCRFSLGYWMSRSSVVWGPFSVVWGVAIAAVTALLHNYKDKSSWFLFWSGTLLGGAYEYFCSVFTELVFGKVFWDYSKIPFNLGGRINLLYCFFWGFAAIIWFKCCYPRIDAWIEKIPMWLGKTITWCLVIFMSCNMLFSSMALIRYEQRSEGVAAKAEWQIYMDTYYDDAKMEKIYPKAKKIH